MTRRYLAAGVIAGTAALTIATCQHAAATTVDPLTFERPAPPAFSVEDVFWTSAAPETSPRPKPRPETMPIGGGTVTIDTGEVPQVFSGGGEFVVVGHPIVMPEAPEWEWVHDQPIPAAVPLPDSLWPYLIGMSSLLVIAAVVVKSKDLEVVR